MTDAWSLCALEELPEAGARRFDVDGHRIAVVRIGESVYAIGDRCSHADYSLSEGEVLTRELELECPKHGSSFSLTTGESQSLPATKPVPVYRAVVEDGVVVVSVT